MKIDPDVLYYAILMVARSEINADLEEKFKMNMKTLAEAVAKQINGAEDDSNPSARVKEVMRAKGPCGRDEAQAQLEALLSEQVEFKQSVPPLTRESVKDAVRSVPVGYKCGGSDNDLIAKMIFVKLSTPQPWIKLERAIVYPSCGKPVYWLTHEKKVVDGHSAIVIAMGVIRIFNIATSQCRQWKRKANSPESSMRHTNDLRRHSATKRARTPRHLTRIHLMEN